MLIDYDIGSPCFLWYPLLPQFDTTMNDPIPPMIIMNRMIAIGFRDTGSIEKHVTVVKESGYLAIGNGDRINKKIGGIQKRKPPEI